MTKVCSPNFILIGFDAKSPITTVVDYNFPLQFSFVIKILHFFHYQVKVATMNYLRTLVLHMEAMEVQTLTLTSAEQEMALGKIITWTYEPKSVEVRKAAMASVVALFRLNANHFSMVLHKLPKVYQDNAADLVAEFVMSASSATLTDSMTRSSDLTSAMKPINAPEANNGGGLTVSISKN